MPAGQRGRDDPVGQDVLRRAGDASVLILTSLADGPKHGYALIQDIKGFAGLQLGPGTLYYGALDRLEGLGLVEALPTDDRRHPYRMTAAGAAALGAHLDRWSGSVRWPAPAAAGRDLMPGPQLPAWSAQCCGCYPRQWRRRRGEEAAELAVLLMRDETSRARSIAWSYLGGAAREAATAKPGHPLGGARPRRRLPCWPPRERW